MEERVNTVIPELPEMLCKLWCLVSSSHRSDVPQLDPLVEYFINKLEKYSWWGKKRNKVLFHYEGQIRITIR